MHFATGSALRVLDQLFKSVSADVQITPFSTSQCPGGIYLSRHIEHNHLRAIWVPSYCHQHHFKYHQELHRSPTSSEWVESAHNLPALVSFHFHLHLSFGLCCPLTAIPYLRSLQLFPTIILCHLENFLLSGASAKIYTGQDWIGLVLL